MDLSSLESVANEAMRIPCGSFKSIPKTSLQIITEEPPLRIRRGKLNLKYYYKVKVSYKTVFKYITTEQEAFFFKKKYSQFHCKQN